MKVFISWSGSQSRELALVLRDWLPDVLQAVRPWMSAVDLEAGVRWSSEVAKELSESSFGILCVTPDSLAAPWLLFEAGALTKALEHTRVCPILLGLSLADLPSGPLAQFQAKTADRDGLLELAQGINDRLGELGVSGDRLLRNYDLHWESLSRRLEEVRAVGGVPPASPRSADSLLAEILALVRDLSRTATTDEAALPATDPSASSRRSRRVYDLHELDNVIQQRLAAGYTDDQIVERLSQMGAPANWVRRRLAVLAGIPTETERGTRRAEYLCYTCDEIFGAPVVHCPECSHHYPLEDRECGNCHLKWPEDAEAATPVD